MRREFPRPALAATALSRRRFLQLTAASLALARLTACAAPTTGKIVPYVKQPEPVEPGVPLFFATALTLGGYATGVLVESHEGRPAKIEGNPDHPASLGATNAMTQAEFLTLYDPDRSRTVKQAGQNSTWERFASALPVLLQAQRASQGAGLRIMTETITSPTLDSQLQTILKLYPAAKWIHFEPVSRDNVRAGAQLAFGQDVSTVYHFDKADIVVSLDADFFQDISGGVR